MSAKKATFAPGYNHETDFHLSEDAVRGHPLQIQPDLQKEKSVHVSRTDFSPAPPDVCRLRHLNIMIKQRNKTVGFKQCFGSLLVSMRSLIQNHGFKSTRKIFNDIC
jgi:hypothetical protein